MADESKPFLNELNKRQTLNSMAKFFTDLAALVGKNKGVKRIVTVWLYINWLNDPRLSKTRRQELADQIVELVGRPIHPARWKSVERELTRLGRMHRIGERSQLKELVQSAVFLAAARMEAEQPEDPLSFVEEIVNAFKAVRRLVNDLLTEDLAGPEWRRKAERSEVEYDAPQQSLPPKRRHSSRRGDPRTEKTQSALPKRSSQTPASPSLMIDRLIDQEDAERRAELLERVLQKLALLSRKSPGQIKAIMAKEKVDSIKALATELGIERTKIIRQVVNPARDSERNSR